MIHPILNNILIISLSCSGIAILLLVVRKLIGKDTGAWWRSTLWVLLLVRLCIPLMIESPIGMLNRGFNNRAVNQITNIEYNNAVPEAHTVNTEMSASDENEALSVDFTQNNQLNNPNSFSWISFVNEVYLFGLILAFLVLMLRIAILNFKVSKLMECEDNEVLRIFNDVKQRYGIRRNILLVIDNANSVPALCGLITPLIIIPQNTLNKMSESELEYIFIHELTHYKRGDIAKLWLLELVACIHWFNPILHIIKPVIVQDIELACDERVISKIGVNEYANYGNVLVNCSTTNRTKHPLVVTSNFAGRRGSKLKERLVMIKKYNRRKIITVGIMLVLLLATILVACTTANTPNTDSEDISNDGIVNTEAVSDSPVEVITESMDDGIPVKDLNSFGGYGESILERIMIFMDGDISIGDIIEEWSMPYIDGAFRLKMTTSTDEYNLSVLADENIDREVIFNPEIMTLTIESTDKWTIENPDAEYILDNMITPYIEQKRVLEDEDNYIDEYPPGIYAVYYNLIREEIMIDLPEDAFDKAYNLVYQEHDKYIDLSQYQGTEDEFFTTDIYLNKNGEFHGGVIEILINSKGSYALRFKDNGWMGVLAEDTCDDIIEIVKSETDWNFIGVNAIKDIVKAEITVDGGYVLATLTEADKLDELENMLSNAKCIGYTPKTTMYLPLLTLTLENGEELYMFLDELNDYMLLGSSFHYDYGPGYIDGNSINNLPDLMSLFNIDYFEDISPSGDISQLDITYAMDVVRDYFTAIENEDASLIANCVHPDRYDADAAFFDEFSGIKLTLDTVYDYNINHQTDFNYHLDNGDAMLIVVQVDFTVEYLVDNPNTPYNDGQYTGWNFILIRERLGSPWKIYDQGY